jgi:hypothetical protein
MLKYYISSVNSFLSLGLLLVGRFNGFIISINLPPVIPNLVLVRRHLIIKLLLSHTRCPEVSILIKVHG